MPIRKISRKGVVRKISIAIWVWIFGVMILYPIRPSDCNELPCPDMKKWNTCGNRFLALIHDLMHISIQVGEKTWTPSISRTMLKHILNTHTPTYGKLSTLAIRNNKSWIKPHRTSDIGSTLLEKSDKSISDWCIIKCWAPIKHCIAGISCQIW